MNLFIISLIPYFICLIGKLKKSMQMLQQNYYDDDNRYFKWIIVNFSNIFINMDLLFIFVLLGVFFNFYGTIGLFIIIYCLIYLNTKKNNKKDKIPLAVTYRIKRLVFTISVLFFVMFIPMIINFKSDNIIFYYVMLGLFNYFIYFIVMVSNVINKPIEKCVYLKFKYKAQNKLKAMNLPVVGVTGSYGKTSSKNIINDILNIKMNAFATPKSFNTPYGIINAINNKLDKFSDIFIAEMGAFKVGEIKTICDLVKPKYGILTKIGEAHLESFGSIENIQRGKFELIESLPEDGLAILNGDDPYQLNYNLKNKCKVKWISIENKDVDLYACNIKLDSKGTSFDCIFKGDKNKYTFKTRLLGKHNIYNVLAGILLGYELGLSIDELKRGVSSVNQIEHRLELKKYGNINIIDDAYNSNPVGSKMALDVLNLMNGLKIIVTPGMIELGSKQYELNYKFGKYISSVCDYVILVGEKQTKPIYKGLIDSNYDKDKIFVLNDVKEAFVLMKKLANKSTYVLLENDLPDLFNE